MKLINKEVICPVCGNKHNFKDVMSIYIKDSYLDGQPYDVNMTFGIDECPNCHYVTKDINLPVNQEIKKIVLSQEYKNDAINLDHEYFILNSMHTLHNRCIEELFWYKRNHGMEYKDEIEKCITKKETDFKAGRINDESYLAYIDLLRQSGRFDDCKQAIESLLNSTNNDYIKQLIDFEKILIEKKDTNSHLHSEMSKK